MAPNIAYLLPEAQPAMKIPNVLTDVTAIMYRTPTFKSARKVFLAKGITAIVRRRGATMTTGTRVKASLSAPAGIRSSFEISFRISAIG